MHRAMSECSRLLWSNVYLFSDSVPSLDRQKNMNEVNHFLEEGILQAVRNLLPVKSILRDSLQEDDDDGIQLEKQEAKAAVPEDNEELEDKVPGVPESVKVDEVPEAAKVPEVSEVPEVTKLPEVPSQPAELKQETLFVDTERSVGFTGIDSIFGLNGEAELRESNEESDELKIVGELEELDMGEIEEIDAPVATPIPLSADDYESL